MEKRHVTTHHRASDDNAHIEESIRASDAAIATALKEPPKAKIERGEPESLLPTVGRIVLYRTGGPGSVPEAALIVGLNENGSVQLVVWNASGVARSEMLVRRGDGPKQWQFPKLG